MNLSNSRDPWAELARRAARSPDNRDADMPLGFDTRVLAHWRGQADDLQYESDLIKLLRQLAWTGCTVLALSLALNLRALVTPAGSTPSFPDASDLVTAALFPD